MNVHINIRERVAEVQGDPIIICGNSDIAVYFDFDAEWSAYPIRTARFEFWKNGIYLHHDVVFSGTALMAPPLYDVGEVAIGVYASNIKTTTPARVPCSPCILDDSPAHDDPPLDVYDQLLATLQEIESGTSIYTCGATVHNGAGAVTAICGETEIQEE